jgi:hypothetical protein
VATKKVATQIRVDEKLYEEIKAIAVNERRSINNQIEFFLAQGVEHYQKPLHF